MEKNEKEEPRGICCICGEEHGLGDLRHIVVKKRGNKICRGCADIIHGLV
jgi:hypothetical protein